MPRATELAPDLPLACDAFFERALARDRRARFRAVQDLVAAFAALADGSVTVSGAPTPASLAGLAAVAFAAGAACLTAGVVLLVVRPGGREGGDVSMRVAPGALRWGAPSRARVRGACLWAATALLAAACDSIAGLDEEWQFVRGPGEGTCASAADCDDGLPCTTDACEAGACRHDPIEGPSPRQIGGDCAENVCSGGVESAAEGPLDVEDDHEPCTVDECQSGSPVHAPLSDGEACQSAGAPWTCQSGRCEVHCTNAEPACPDDGNPCTDEACDVEASLCLHTPLDGVDVPGAPQKLDCKVARCVAGAPAVVTDDAELPHDDNDCTDDRCDGGEPSNPPLVERAPCAGVASSRWATPARSATTSARAATASTASAATSRRSPAARNASRAMCPGSRARARPSPRASPTRRARTCARARSRATAPAAAGRTAAERTGSAASTTPTARAAAARARRSPAEAIPASPAPRPPTA
jgi:hypothetical protein